MLDSRRRALCLALGALLWTTRLYAQDHGAMELVEHAAYDYVSHAANQAWLGDTHAGAPKPSSMEKVTSLLAFGVGMTWGPFPAAGVLGVSKIVKAVKGRSRGEVRLGAFQDRPDREGVGTGHNHSPGALAHLPAVTVRCSGGHAFEITPTGDPRSVMEMSARLLQLCEAAAPTERPQFH